MNRDGRRPNGGGVALDRTAWVDVSLDILEANAAVIVREIAPQRLGAVVKADGYGHGLEMAARAAVHGGAEWLCVAMMGEAIRLRTDGYHGPVFCLYPVPVGLLRDAARLGIDTPIASVEHARQVAAAVPGFPVAPKVHLEVDTGMTRGGLRPESALDALNVLRRADVEIVGLWTHLSAPEDQVTTATQVATFDDVAAAFSDVGIDVPLRHVAASGGMLVDGVGPYELCRVGLAYYGENPDAEVMTLPAGISPALAVVGRPVRVSEVPRGTSVGYGGTWTATRHSRIATVPVGYADGWSRASSPGTMALVQGQRSSVVGRVSSDSLTVDVTDTDSDGDDLVVLLGPQEGERITADEVADVRGTISWEVLQQLHARLPRLYRVGGEVIGVRAHMSTHVEMEDERYVGPYGTEDR